jgi:hypothetical protein
MTYDQIGNDPVQLTSKESVEFRLSHTKREPKAAGAQHVLDIAR